MRLREAARADIHRDQRKQPALALAEKRLARRAEESACRSLGKPRAVAHLHLRKGKRTRRTREPGCKDWSTDARAWRE